MLTILNMEDGNILLNSEDIQALIANPSAFHSLKVEVRINCCPDIAQETWNMPLMGDTKMQLDTDGLIIKKPFFSLTSGQNLRDGVYHFTIKIFTDVNNYNYQENCYFIDVTYKCKVAQHIDTLLDKTEDGECATNAHVLHYALVNGSNCGCNCEAMCEVFKELTKLILPPQNQDCGC